MESERTFTVRVRDGRVLVEERIGGMVIRAFWPDDPIGLARQIEEAAGKPEHFVARYVPAHKV